MLLHRAPHALLLEVHGVPPVPSTSWFSRILPEPGADDTDIASKASLLMRLLAPGFDGWSVLCAASYRTNCGCLRPTRHRQETLVNASCASLSRRTSRWSPRDVRRSFSQNDTLHSQLGVLSAQSNQFHLGLLCFP